MAAHGSLMGARGNSGVIISQMLRGFAHHLRHKREVDTFAVATAMKEAVAAAKQALLRPVDGTIISVAEAAAEAAYTAALKERDFYRFVTAVLRQRTRRSTGRRISFPSSKKPASSIPAERVSCISWRAFLRFFPM